MKIGLISDTHDHFDPRLPGLLQGVEHILHGGDVGGQSVLSELEAIAPVTAVLGNTDVSMSLRETEWVELGGKTFLVQHIVNPRQPSEALRRRLVRDRPNVVVYGHTHHALAEVISGILFLNPGAAGRSRPGQPRTVATLEWDGSGLRHEFLAL